jgi:hypothetical protein
MNNYTNYTNNFTFANFSSTIMYDQFQEYLDNPMFIPLIIVSWLLLNVNHKCNKSIVAFKSFKEQSADEIFTLQKLLARDDTVGDSIGNTLCPCCANAAVTTLPVSHPIAKCPRDTMMDAFCDEMITKMKALMKDKRATEEEYADLDGKWNSLCCCGGKLHGFGDPRCCKKW